MLKILIVCTANICRSPAAEHLMKQAWADCNVHIESVGINGAYGAAADVEVVRMLKTGGVESIETHLSKPVGQVDVYDFDLILCMENHHIRDLQRLLPHATGRVFLLGHWQNQEIADPHGLDETAYQTAYNSIKTAIHDWEPHLASMGLLQCR